MEVNLKPQSNTAALAQRPGVAPHKAAAEPPAASSADGFTRGELEASLLPSFDPMLRGVGIGGFVQVLGTHVRGEITNDSDPSYKKEIGMDRTMDTKTGQFATTANVGDLKTTEMTGMEQPIGGGIMTGDVITQGSVEGPAGKADINTRQGFTRQGFATPSLHFEGKIGGYESKQDQTVEMGMGAGVNHYDGFIMGAGGHQVAFSHHLANATAFNKPAELSGQFGNAYEKGTSSMLDDGSILVDRTIGSYHIKEKITFDRMQGLTPRDPSPAPAPAPNTPAGTTK